MEIKVHDDYNLYNKHKFSFEENCVNVLVGKNGCGKSTLLREVEYFLSKEDIPHIVYNNLRDGGSNATSKYGFYGHMDLMASSLFNSEGQNIHQNIGVFASQIRQAKLKMEKNGAKTLWVLIDALDSGLSIDNIVDVKENLFSLVLDDFKMSGLSVGFIVSANTFELARDYDCIDVKTAKKIRFNTYDEFRDFVLKRKS